jgi:hypothetical protein
MVYSEIMEYICAQSLWQKYLWNHFKNMIFFCVYILEFNSFALNCIVMWFSCDRRWITVVHLKTNMFQLFIEPVALKLHRKYNALRIGRDMILCAKCEKFIDLKAQWVYKYESDLFGYFRTLSGVVVLMVIKEISTFLLLCTVLILSRFLSCFIHAVSC